MANVLEVSMQQSIITLSERGWSQRRIARELGVHRETVGRYLRLHAHRGARSSKPAISTAGSSHGNRGPPICFYRLALRTLYPVFY